MEIYFELQKGIELHDINNCNYLRFLTIEWPKYSAALSEMYNNFPVCVVIIINPLRPCKK